MVPKEDEWANEHGRHENCYGERERKKLDIRDVRSSNRPEAQEEAPEQKDGSEGEQGRNSLQRWPRPPGFGIGSLAMHS